MKKLLLNGLFICLSVLAFSQTYTFKGNGNWTVAANWENNQIPPDVLPRFSEIIVDPIATGQCILNTKQTISTGAKLTVKAGKKFTILSDYLVLAELPTLVTLRPATELTTTSAKVSGVITHDGGIGISERGFYYGTSHLLVDDNVVKAGSGLGNFSGTITGLQANTTYYYQSYAINSLGTFYGEVESFTTISNKAPESFTCGSPFTVQHTAGTVAPVSKMVTYGTVMTAIGAYPSGSPAKCWITQNLGADRQAAALNDNTEAASGWYWQFNRTQGYKVDDAGNRTPGTAWNTPIDENSNWVQANDPCFLLLGTGWRIPTQTEWSKVNNSWYYNGGSYASVLKVHKGGNLASTTGALTGRGTLLNFWTNTQSGATTANSLDLAGIFTSDKKARAMPLRCIKDEGVAAVPTLTTMPVTSITASRAFTGGSITDNGGAIVIAKGVVYDTLPNPVLLKSSSVSGGEGSGDFQIQLLTLLPNKQYFVRAFATTNAGTGYGDEVKFTTAATLPTIVSPSFVQSSDKTEYTFVANITADGGSLVIARGVVIGKAPDPTIDNGMLVPSYQGTGIFTATFGAPEAGVKYYMRGYAENSIGVSYTEPIVFTVPLAPCLMASPLTITHQAGNVAPVSKTVTYKTAQLNITGSSKCWILQNLGADHQATSVSDATEAAAGWYWQFNRKQGYKTNGANLTPAASWVTTIDENSDWIPANDPCKLLLGDGWRIPTFSEWSSARKYLKLESTADGFQSILKLHPTGWFFSPNILKHNNDGFYWSSQQSNPQSAGQLHVSKEWGFHFLTAQKEEAMSIRCLKE